MTTDPMHGMSKTSERRPQPETTKAAPSHDEIEQRAFEIFLRTGSRHGRCADNWRCAEQELRQGTEARQEVPDAPGGNGSVNPYSEVMNGRRPKADMRLLDAVMRVRLRNGSAPDADGELAPERGPVCEPTVQSRAGVMPGTNGGLSSTKRGAAPGRRGSK